MGSEMCIRDSYPTYLKSPNSRRDPKSSKCLSITLYRATGLWLSTYISLTKVLRTTSLSTKSVYLNLDLLVMASIARVSSIIAEYLNVLESHDKR